MKVLSLCSGPVETNCYLLIDKATASAVAIDTPIESADWFVSSAMQEGVTIREIWLTHSHWDHTADCAELKRRCGANVLIHLADEYRLRDPNAHLVFSMPYTFESSAADSYIEHGSILNCGDSKWEVRHTPGHTEGGVCFVNHEHKMVFAGDTLFCGSIGRTDLPGGDYTTLIHSIHTQLLVLGDEYLVYPGHMQQTSIGEERLDNPFLQDRL